MSEKLSVPAAEVLELFRFLERLNEIYHSDERSGNHELVEEFWRSHGYRELHRFYYDVVWNWLPRESRQRIEDEA